MLNILDDASAERLRLEETQKAMLNILDDFEAEKNKVEQVNEELRRENRERRLTAQALTERSIELSRSNADLEQFAYVASHDLQEPLRMVSSYVQLLERRYHGQLDAQADKYIQYAVEGSRRMQSLIGGLLEYSRVGLDDSLRQPLALDEAVDLALANLRGALDESGATLERTPLPMVVADRAQMAQVLQNLLANALKFRHPDRAVRLRLDATVRSGETIIMVADNGIGIDPQYAERIFMIFQRLHTRNEYPGTGIGLAICKKVIDRHGGRVWVEPTAGGGATFCFTLPLAARGRP
ncbi:MAG: hypothetical protein EOO75_01630 [Myxococcales bacterium]|nr:MAG: hypothetical protein EOO75_01630 [Myxococcales bacterium]